MSIVWNKVAITGIDLSVSGSATYEYTCETDDPTATAEDAYFASGPPLIDQPASGLEEIPAKGDSYPGELEELQDLIVTDVRIRREAATPSKFLVTVDFGTPQTSSDNEEDQGKEPWDRTPDISVDGTQVSIASFVDFKGRPYVNSSGDSVSNGLGSVQVPSVQINYSRAYRISPEDGFVRVAQYSGRSNSEPFQFLGTTFPPNTLLAQVKGSQQFYNLGDGRSIRYWQETISLTYAPRKHIGNYLDEGFRGVDGNGNVRSFAVATGLKNGGTEVVWSRDDDVSPVPFALNGAGKLLTALGLPINAPATSHPTDLVEINTELSGPKAVLLNWYDVPETDFEGLV